MDRDIKIFNRPIIQKIQKKNQEMHLQRLRNIKVNCIQLQSGISSGKPSVLMGASFNNHKICNKKAVLQQQQKKTEIQKQNVMLFNRMVKIMKREDSNQPNNYPIVSPASRVTKTAIENSRISEENRCKASQYVGIIQRLSQQRPTISYKKQQEDRMKHLNILRFLGKYPNPIALRTSFQSRGSNSRALNNSARKTHVTCHQIGDSLEQAREGETYDQEMRRYQEELKKIKQRQIQSVNRRHRFTSQALHKKQHTSEGDEQTGFNVYDSRMQQKQKVSMSNYTKLSALQNQKSLPRNQSPSPQILLYQGFSTIHRLTASVKFFRTYNSYLIRAQFENPVQGQTIFQLEIPQQDGNQFFSQQNYNYRVISNMLMLEEGRLVLHVGENTQNTLKQHLSDNVKLGLNWQNNHLLDHPHEGTHLIEVDTSQPEYQNQQQDKDGEGKVPNWTKYQQALQQSIQ